MANLEKGKQIKLALKFKPNAVAGFNAKEDIQKLMIMIKSSSTPVMGRFESEDEQGEIWKCEVKVPQDGLTGQIVMVLKNGPRALLNYKCI